MCCGAMLFGQRDAHRPHRWQSLALSAAVAVPEAPAVTVRVCDGLSCTMAGAAGLLQRLQGVDGERRRFQSLVEAKAPPGSREWLTPGEEATCNSSMRRNRDA